MNLERKKKVLDIERGSTRSHCSENTVEEAVDLS